MRFSHRFGRVMGAFGLTVAAMATTIPERADALGITPCASVTSHSFRNDGGLIVIGVNPGDVITIAVEDFVGNFSLSAPSVGLLSPSQPYTFTATVAENVELGQVAGGAIITCAVATAGSVTG